MLNLRQIFYITNDVERAVLSAPMEGIEYHIVTSRNPYSEYLSFERSTAKSRNTLMNFSTSSKNNIFLVNGPKTSTEELMKRPEVVEYIQKHINCHPKLDLGSSNKQQKEKGLNSFGFLDSEVSSLGMTRVERPFILVFKPTVEIEEFCEVIGWRLLNPFSKISEEFEEKISQIKLLKSLGVSVPKHLVAELGELAVVKNQICYTPCPALTVSAGHPSPASTEASAGRQEGNDNNPIPRMGGSSEARDGVGLPAILQYNLGHTGEGTLVIRREKDLELLKKKFPKREVRVSEYIQGIPITVNAIVGKKVYVSAPSLQITGIPLLTANKFATVGNDWSWFSKSSQQQTVNKIQKITKQIGNELKKRGFRGAFGVDLIQQTENNKQKTRNPPLFVIEVNSRQPASVIYESRLQVESRRSVKSKVESHNPAVISSEALAKSRNLTEGGSAPLMRSLGYARDDNAANTMSLHLKCLLGKDTGKERLPETLEGSQIFVRAKKDMKWKKEIPPQFTDYESGIRNYGRERSRPFPTEYNAREYFIFSKLRNGEFVKKNSEVLRVQSNGRMVERPMELKTSVARIVKKLLS